MLGVPTMCQLDTYCTYAQMRKICLLRADLGWETPLPVPNNMLTVPYIFRPRDMHVSNGETTTTSAVVEDMRVRCRRITAFSVSTRPWASRTKSVPISVFSILCAPQNKFGAGLDEERTSDNHHCIYVEH
jgi:hypothetical protein